MVSTYSADDLKPHTPTSDLLWNESMLLYWFDDVAGIGGFHRIGYQPNRGVSNYQCGASTLDGVRFRRTKGSFELSGDERRATGFRFDDFMEITYSPEASRWTASCDEYEMDLSFIDALPRYSAAQIWHVDNHITRNMSSEHYEVPGRVTGSVRIGDRIYSISCLGYRDHSWGVRNWTVVAAYRWFTGSFGPNFTWTFSPTMGQQGDFFNAGYVIDGGRIERIGQADIVVMQEIDGMSARGAIATIETVSGRRFRIELEAFDNITMEIDDHVSCFALGRMKMGDQIGVGVCEVFHNVRNGKERPKFLLGAALENGISRRRPFGTLR